MNVIWENALVSVPDVLEQMPRELAYTTVMTTVRILEEKGFVTQCGKRGRAFLYKAKVDRKEIQGAMSNQLANRLFNGSIKSLVMNLVQQDSITADDLAEVKEMIAKLESNQ